MTLEELYRHHICGAPCVISDCDSPGELHHLRGRHLGGGIGLKPSILTGIPLCPFHHGQIHAIGIDSFEDRHKIDLLRELISQLQGFIEWLHGYWFEDYQRFLDLREEE